MKQEVAGLTWVFIWIHRGRWSRDATRCVIPALCLVLKNPTRNPNLSEHRIGEKKLSTFQRENNPYKYKCQNSHSWTELQYWILIALLAVCFIFGASEKHVSPVQPYFNKFHISFCFTDSLVSSGIDAANVCFVYVNLAYNCVRAKKKEGSV